METSLRLVLLLIGFVIVIGIIWDTIRGNKKRKKLAAHQEQLNLKKEAFLLNEFNDGLSFDETISVKNRPVPSLSSASPSVSKSEEFVVLHVMAKLETFSGGELLDAFSEIYLYYGEMQIFYRYENIDGTGNTIFNVVSAVEPGYFEISKIQNFSTPGITLFFTLTQPNQSIAAFELMLRTAKQLALRLDGEVIDDRCRLLTTQIIEQYRDRVRKVQPRFRTIKAS